MLTKDQEYQVRKLRAEYVEKHPSLRKLWELDAKVKDPAKEAGWACFILGVLFIGLNVIMADAWGYWGGENYDTWYTVVTFCTFDIEMPEMVCNLIASVSSFCGPVLVVAAYPVYRLILKARRRKYAREILQLTNELLND